MGQGTGPLDDAALSTPILIDGGAGQPTSRRSLVLTMDVITPIVDDPRAFGAIAAANALSDVYAMGGRPELALTFLGFPTDKLPLETLREVLLGVRATCARARCAIVGGHTIVDPEPKCGLSVTGSVDPQKAWTHTRAGEGSILILTKPIGTGIVGQSIRAGTASDSLIATVTAQMQRLNDTACEAGLAFGATSCTDITGFGLLGHLRHIAEAASLTARIQSKDVPLIPGAQALAEQGLVPGGTRRNLKYVTSVTSFADTVPDPMKLLLADAQTSGGLLLCLPPSAAQEALRRLLNTGCEASAIIGELAPHREGDPYLEIK